MRVATISGALQGVPVAIEVSDNGPTDVFQRVEAFRARHCLTTDKFIARVTMNGFRAFTPPAVEDFLNEQAQASEGDQLADMGVAPTA